MVYNGVMKIRLKYKKIKEKLLESVALLSGKHLTEGT
jgi:hypothetical protein